MPFFANVNPTIGATSAFDLPPEGRKGGRRVTMPLGGSLVALGGHVHGYARSVRLVDVENGKVLVRLKAHLTPNGRAAHCAWQESLRLPRGGAAAFWPTIVIGWWLSTTTRRGTCSSKGAWHQWREPSFRTTFGSGRRSTRQFQCEASHRQRGHARHVAVIETWSEQCSMRSW